MADDRHLLPLATAEMEAHVKEVFPIDITPEQFAAEDGAGWMEFTFHQYRFQDPELDSWIHAVGKIIADPQSLEEAQRQYLSPDEFTAASQYKQDHDLIDDPDDIDE